MEIAPVLHFDLFLEVDCQFHHALLFRAAEILIRNALILVIEAHAVQFLLELAILNAILVFFGWIIVLVVVIGQIIPVGSIIFSPLIQRDGFAVNFRARFGESHAFLFMQRL